MDSHLEEKWPDWIGHPHSERFWRRGEWYAQQSINPSGQILQLENGKLEGSQLSFDVNAREPGGSKNIHFFGQVEGDSITMHNESNGKPGQTMVFHKLKG